MQDMELVILILNVIIIVLLVILCLRTSRIKNNERGESEESRILNQGMLSIRQDMDRLRNEMREEQELFRSSLSKNIHESMGNLSDMISSGMKNSSDYQRNQLADMDGKMQQSLETAKQSQNSHLTQFEERLKTSSVDTTQKLEVMRTAMESRLDSVKVTVEKSLGNIREDNNKRLDDMKAIVDEKLQRTINERMNESFKLVNDRLEQVYKGLGEMQTLAQGVGDLKKVMANVKTRGILGEIQLSAIINEILAPGQYEQNVVTKKGSGKYVEFAVKIPSEDGSSMYLPIDSKFPGETYGALCDAYENGSSEIIAEKRKILLNTIKAEAKDIRDKYIDPPATTEFAIMFLPFEGLYAEIVNQGFVEILQRDYHVNIAGPSTMAALLNSLQMGFKTFAIQKRSGEVWQVLGAIRTEFDKFAGALASTQNRLNQANDELEKLVGTRTRQMQRKLEKVTLLSEEDADKILELADGAEDKG